MTTLRLFTDGSVNPKSKVGYGAYLAVLLEVPYSESFKAGDTLFFSEKHEPAAGNYRLIGIG